MSAGASNEQSAGPTRAADALHDAMASARDWGDDRPSPEQIGILRGMTPEQRWRAASRLYWTCRRHKAAFLQSQHPDWPGERVEHEVREIFSHART